MSAVVVAQASKAGKGISGAREAFGAMAVCHMYKRIAPKATAAPFNFPTHVCSELYLKSLYCISDDACMQLFMAATNLACTAFLR